MTRKQTFAAISFLLSMLFLVPLGAIANEDDDYLKQLSNEINRPEYLDQINVELAKLEKLEDEGKLVVTASNMIMLENQLNKYAPSAYNFFVELSFVEKKRIYNFMKKGKLKLSMVLKEILKIANDK